MLSQDRASWGELVFAAGVAASLCFAAIPISAQSLQPEGTVAPEAPDAAPVATEDACAKDAEDPLESVNRATSSFNRAVRENVIDPAVDVYQENTSQEVQEGVSNFFSNLTEPITVVASLLQGDLDNAGTSAGRFAVNTTYGVLGVNDRATEMGLEQRREDLGQALGANGVCPGPHIVLPILGPSNIRDALSDIATGLANPLPLAAQAAQGTVEYSDSQEIIQAATSTSIDPYITERDGYEQHREFQVQNGAAIPAMDTAEFEEVYADDPGS
jgi:phospholipid-binding lipoprotein MlaA